MIPNSQFWYNNKGSDLVTPSPLILTWYNSLAVKPSNALLTDLNTLVDGLNADGNWAKLDLFGLVAGMETQEQQLRPLITTSGDDFVIDGAPVLNANGVRNDGGLGRLNLKWNPTDDGAQYTLNSAFLSSYVGNFPIGFDIAMGSTDSGSGNLSWLYLDGSGGTQAYVNVDQLETPAISLLALSSFYTAGVINGGNLTSYANAVTDVVTPALPLILPTLDFFGCDANGDGSGIGSGGDAYFRHFMAGAGTANQEQIRTRLNTFYTTRGL